jgi:hypothetical protein
MLDPLINQLYEIWYANFGMRSMKVKELLLRSPPQLVELFLHFAHEHDNRHKISTVHMGRFLAKLVRRGPVSGWQMRSRQVNKQAAFSLIDADDAPSRALVARPGTTLAAVRLLDLPENGLPPPEALEVAIKQAQRAVLAAMQSGDIGTLLAAKELLKETERAAMVYLASWNTVRDVQKPTIRSHRPGDLLMALTPAQKQQAYRDRIKAKRDVAAAEAARVVETQRQRELAIIAERDRISMEIERQARMAEEQAAIAAAEARQKAEEEAKARGIADGTLHPSGRPWQAGDVRGYDASSPRALMEAGRRSAGRYAVEQFDKTNALRPDPDGPRRRTEYPAPRLRYDWHRDY